jgi:[ribosomal protein S5]-alanine N-acetyltransferase
MTSNDPYTFSEHYHLSKHTRDDAPQIVKYLSNELIAGQLRAVPNPYNLLHALHWFDQLDEDRKIPDTAPLRWCIRETSSGMLIGDISLKPMEDGRYQLGYWLAPEYWGKGIMTNSVTEVFDIVKREDSRVRRVLACAKEGNLGSRRVIEKLGFKSIGHHEEGAPAYLIHDFERGL